MPDETPITYDTVVIGGGFYGLRIAQFLQEVLGHTRVLILEKGSDVMQRASYNNQARVHNGYHYPRSILTALRSRVNLPNFSTEYEKAIVNDFTKYYAVARNFSKVSARQFQRFFERIDAEISIAKDGMEYFDPRLIEEVFLVKEYAFNSKILKDIVLDRLSLWNTPIHTQEEALEVRKTGGFIEIVTDKGTYRTKNLINTTYSALNHVNQRSGLPVLPLKHELTEMCLVKMPKELVGKAFTIMCGPFFSLMPFPDKGLYTMSHVRYTPHCEWYDEGDVIGKHAAFSNIERKSNFRLMHADIKRYMPKAAEIEYSQQSLWEVKTVLAQSESDDSRPILYKTDFGGIKNYTCIMGGKIDNIYDVLGELKKTYA